MLSLVVPKPVFRLGTTKPVLSPVNMETAVGLITTIPVLSLVNMDFVLRLVNTIPVLRPVNTQHMSTQNLCWSSSTQNLC